MGYLRRVETSDFHKKKNLQTHYYKNDFRRCRDELEAFARKNNFQVKNINNEYKEISLIIAGVEVNIAVIEISPIEIAVEMVASRDPYDLMLVPLPDFSKCEKAVNTVYKHLDKTLILKYIGGRK